MNMATKHHLLAHMQLSKVWGPWQCLEHGAAFIDLPGFGDINAVRNRIANKYYEQAQFVCLGSL